MGIKGVWEGLWWRLQGEGGRRELENWSGTGESQDIQEKLLIDV